MADPVYDPRYFEEDHVFDAPGLLGWLTGRRKNAVLALLHSGLSPRAKVLDVGCGYGDMLAETQSDVRVGIDVNFNALRQAVTRRSGALFAMAAVEHLPFASNSFDGVICSEVLEHLEHPDVLAQEIVRVTKPDGVYCITVPNEGITTFGRFILGKRPAKSPAHKQQFTPATIAALFPTPPEVTIMAPYGPLPFTLSTNVVVRFRKR